MREQIKSFASTKQIFSSGIKLIILDEADAMTRDAQAALRRSITSIKKNNLCEYLFVCLFVSFYYYYYFILFYFILLIFRYLSIVSLNNSEFLK